MLLDLLLSFPYHALHLCDDKLSWEREKKVSCHVGNINQSLGQNKLGFSRTKATLVCVMPSCGKRGLSYRQSVKAATWGLIKQTGGARTTCQDGHHARHSPFSHPRGVQERKKKRNTQSSPVHQIYYKGCHLSIFFSFFGSTWLHPAVSCGQLNVTSTMAPSTYTVDSLFFCVVSWTGPHQQVYFLFGQQTTIHQFPFFLLKEK